MVPYCMIIRENSKYHENMYTTKTHDRTVLVFSIFLKCFTNHSSYKIFFCTLYYTKEQQEVSYKQCLMLQKEPFISNNQIVLYIKHILKGDDKQYRVIIY